MRWKDEEAHDAVEAIVLTARAEKKWDALDIDDSGFLDAQEVLPLAAWVWESFRPGQTITPEAQHAEAEKIMRRCDLNGDGSIGRHEFKEYYEQTVVAMNKFHRAKAAKAKADARNAPAYRKSSQSGRQITTKEGLNPQVRVAPTTLLCHFLHANMSSKTICVGFLGGKDGRGDGRGWLAQYSGRKEVGSA